MSVEDTEFDFHLMRCGEAAGVVRCVKDEYGDRYPYKIIYDADLFYESCRKGDAISMVAVDGENNIAAHVALAPSALMPGTMELCMGIVCKRYRNRSLMNRISRKMLDHAIENLDLTSVNSQPVTHHVYAQKVCAAQDYRCCGFVFNIANEGLFESPGTDHRGSIALVIKMLKNERRAIHVPGEVLDLVRNIVSDMGLDREFAVSHEVFREGMSEISGETDESLRFADTAVRRIGEDIEERLTSEYEGQVSRGCKVSRLLLNLCDPNAPVAYDIAKSLGYFCTGMFPGCSDLDYLIMMNPMGRPIEYGSLVIHEKYAGLLDLVKKLDPDS